MRKIILVCIILISYIKVYTQTYEFRPVIITAPGYTFELMNYPGNGEIITKEEIEKMAVKDFADVLKIIPGIDVNRRSSVDFEIDARGFNNGSGNGQRMLILINGIPVKNADGTYDFPLINIDEIEKIEILRGNFGSIYGNSAIGGIINIITTKKITNSSSSFEFKIGSYNKFNANVKLNIFRGNDAFIINGSYKKSDGYREKEFEEQKRLNFLHFFNLNKSTIFKWNIIYTEFYRIYPSPLSEEDIEQYSPRKTLSYSRENYNLFLINTKISHFYSPFFNVNAFISYKYRFYKFPDWGTEYQNKIYNMKMWNEKKYSIYKQNGRIITEASFKKEEVKKYLDNKEWGISLHLEQFIYNFILTGGIRYDNIENIYTIGTDTGKKFYNLWNWNAGIVYRIKNLKLYGNISKGIRYPALYESIDLMKGKLTQVTPEKAYNNELGLKFYFYKRNNLAISGYYMNVEDEIIYNGNVNTNFKKINHKGIETELNLYPVKSVDVNIFYNYQYVAFAEGELKGKIVPLNPFHKIGLDIGWKILKHLTLYLNGYWQDKCFIANDLNNSYKEMDSYYILNLSAGYKSSNIKLNLNIYNLLDTHYYEYVIYSLYKGEPYYYPMGGQSYELSFEFKF